MPSLGILPRYLVLEDDGRTADDGAIVCGLNPSPGNSEQRDYYESHGASYDSLVHFWNERKRRKEPPYYQRLRKLVNALRITGPILWTDTVKCEKRGDTKTFSHSRFPATVRRCVARYLHQELEACPHDWIAIGVGRDAFATLSLVCPKRFVLGVPHCTGQFGAQKDFADLFDGDRLKPKFMKQFRDARAMDKTGALWFTAKP
jgi:hypothetical protein